MPLELYPELSKAVLAAMVSAPKPAPHDIEGLRAQLAAIASPMSTVPGLPTIEETLYEVPSYDGHRVSVYRVARKGDNKPSPPGPAIIHAHGGGFIYGAASQWKTLYHQTVQATGVPIYLVDYRLAPEHPFPAAVEDVYAVLKWLHEHAEEVCVDTARIATMGESAGGAIAAAVALMARDRGLSPPLAKQILIYPALDDRNTVANPALLPFATWNYDNNLTAWKAYLGENAGKETVSPYAAPARATRFDGLPTTYIEVGGLDIFRDESIAYAAKIAAADTSVELHVYPGLPHIFETLALGTAVMGRVSANRVAAMTSF
ncbi:Alpha/Beta hydrolase protein [Aspergillus egyptiacus]|nr:Alpha/Beta hydrolase protein [Aspergillus egyptiacus]